MRLDNFQVIGARGIAAIVIGLLFSIAGASVAYANQSSNAPPNLTPSIVPPVNTAVLKDPSGTYTFTYLGPNEYSINASGYEKLQQDPYSGISASNVQTEGNMVIITTPQSNVVSTPTDSNSAWSGAGGGACSSFSTSNGNAICNSSSGSLGTSGVYSDSVTWDEVL